MSQADRNLLFSGGAFDEEHFFAFEQEDEQIQQKDGLNEEIYDDTYYYEDVEDTFEVEDINKVAHSANTNGHQRVRGPAEEDVEQPVEDVGDTVEVLVINGLTGLGLASGAAELAAVEAVLVDRQPRLLQVVLYMHVWCHTIDLLPQYRADLATLKEGEVEVEPNSATNPDNVQRLEFVLPPDLFQAFFPVRHHSYRYSKAPAR